MRLIVDIGWWNDKKEINLVLIIDRFFCYSDFWLCVLLKVIGCMVN